MTNCRRRTILAGLGAWVMLVANLNAQQPVQNVAIDPSACAELETREAQVECYGELVVDELGTQSEPATDEVTSEAAGEEATGEASPAVAAVPEPPIVRSTRTRAIPGDVPGMSRSERRAARRAARDKEREERRAAELANSITATVTALRELQPNHLLVTLDNEQVWRQNRPERYALQVGDEVTLTPSHWGPSYRLRDPNRGGFIQVERVR